MDDPDEPRPELRDQPQQVPIIRREVAFSGAIWDVVTERFQFGAGELTRQFIAHPGAVAVAAVDQQNRILLLEQYRHPIGMRDWELPAGLLDVPGEDPLTAAQRELAEEADLTASNWEPLTALHLSPGSSAERIQLFLARQLAATNAGFARVGEEADLRWEWVPLPEAVRAVTEGRFTNATTGLGILLAAERLK